MWTVPRYFMICLVSAMFLSLMFLYVFIGFKIRALINSYFKYIIIEVKDFKDEPWKGLLEDKIESGNFYQAYFTLINMIRELFFCIILYFLVDNPRVVISILSISQLMNLMAMTYSPPYKKKWMNVNLIISNILYLILDLTLGLLIFGKAKFSEKTKYDIFGFGLIIIVFGLIICNLGISVYFSIAERIRKKREMKKMKQNQNIDKTNLSKIKPVSPRKLDESEYNHLEEKEIDQIKKDQQVPVNETEKNNNSPLLESPMKNIESHNAIQDFSSSMESLHIPRLEKKLARNPDDLKSDEPKSIPLKSKKILHPGSSNTSSMIKEASNRKRDSLKLTEMMKEQIENENNKVIKNMNNDTKIPDIQFNKFSNAKTKRDKLKNKMSKLQNQNEMNRESKQGKETEKDDHFMDKNANSNIHHSSLVQSNLSPTKYAKKPQTVVEKSFEFGKIPQKVIKEKKIKGDIEFEDL